MVYHFTDHYRKVGLGNRLLTHGYLMVDLFFILSGFVLALSHGQLVQQLTWRRCLGFWFRRFGRLYPLYLVTSVAALGLMAAAKGQWVSTLPSLKVGYIAANLVMVQAWGMCGSLNGVTWSVSTEWAASLLFPASAVAILKWHPRWAVVIGCLCGVAVVVLAETPGLYRVEGGLDLATGSTPWPLARCLVEFPLGLTAFRSLQHGRVRSFLSHAWICDGLVVALLALLSVSAADPTIVLLMVVVVAALATETSLTARILASRPIYALGVLSYSIYLTHIFAGRVGMHISAMLHAPHFVLILQVGATLAAAVLTYFAVERPARIITKRGSIMLRSVRLFGVTAV